jgi:hypothetical protein
MAFLNNIYTYNIYYTYSIHITYILIKEVFKFFMLINFLI